MSLTHHYCYDLHLCYHHCTVIISLAVILFYNYIYNVISSKIGCNIHTLHSHECYHYVYIIKTVISGAIMPSDKDHNTPVVLSLKKGKATQSENSISNSSIIMGKEKVSHYFVLVSVSPFCLLTYYVNLMPSFECN